MSLFGICRSTWENDIKMVYEEMGLEGEESIRVGQGGVTRSCKSSYEFEARIG